MARDVWAYEPGDLIYTVDGNDLVYVWRVGSDGRLAVPAPVAAEETEEIKRQLYEELERRQFPEGEGLRSV